MKNIFRFLVISVVVILTSCYGNPEQHSEELSTDVKTDSTLIPQDSTRRDHTETNRSDTILGKTGRVNGL